MPLTPEPHQPDPLRRHHWGWKAFQLAVWLVVGFYIAVQPGTSYLAAVIGGGIMALYATGIINGIVLLALRALGKEVPPQYRHTEGQLDAWAAASGLKDKLARAETSKRGLPPKEPRSP